jgi:glycerophosphoryl diester phosphodiesterase
MLALPQLSPGAGDNRRESARTSLSAKVVTWSILAVILLSGGIIALSIHHDLQAEDTVLVTAHRGSSKKAPENTLSSIRQAIEDGADYAEIDVQETSDGVVVLLHDSDLKKVSGLGKKIWETSYEELKDIDIGTWFSSTFAGERIPTLGEAIDTAKGKIKLNIELKYNGHDEKLAERVVDIVKEKQFEKDCIISSLKYDALLKVEKLDAQLRTGYMVVRSIGDLPALNVDCLCVESGLATASLIARARAVGKEVHVWTVDEVAQMKHFIDLRVNGIITNYPDRLIKILRERAAMSDAERILVKAKRWLN